MIKPYFKDGILTEKFEAITPGFVEALSIGFIRYMGDSRIDYEKRDSLDVEALKKQFFDEDYDSGIVIKSEDDEIKIELFERGDDIGGLEASLPGGVNFEGKVKSVDHALPIPQIAVNHIEHALNTETGFGVLK